MNKSLLRGLSVLVALTLAPTSWVHAVDEVAEVCKNLLLASGKSYPIKAEFGPNDGMSADYLAHTLQFTSWRTGIGLSYDYSAMDSNNFTQVLMEVDTLTGKVTRIKTPPVNYETEPDFDASLELAGKYAIIQRSKMVMVYDTQAKKLTKHELPAKGLYTRAGPDERPVVVRVRLEKNNIVDFFDVATGKSVAWELSKSVRQTSAWSRGDYVTVLMEDGKLGVFNLKTGKGYETAGIEMTDPNYLPQPEISSDGKRITFVRYADDGATVAVQVVNAETGAVVQALGTKEKPVESADMSENGQFLMTTRQEVSADGQTIKYFAQLHKSNSDLSYSLEKEFEVSSPPGSNGAHYSEPLWVTYSGTSESEGTVRIIRQGDGKIFEIDASKLGNYSNVSYGIADSVIALDTKISQFLIKIETDGVSRVFFFDPGKDILREVARAQSQGGNKLVKDSSGPVLVSSKETIRLDLRNLTDASGGLVAKPASNTPTAIKRQVGAWIKNGFDPPKNAPRLVELLLKNAYREMPKEFAAIAAHIAGEYPVLFEQLVQRFPEWEATSRKVQLTAADLKRPAFASALKSAKKYVQRKMDSFPESQGTNWRVWQEIESLTPFLAKMPETTREAMADSIAQSLANAAGSQGDLEGVFISKLYKFTRSFVDHFFGFKPKNLTDFTWIRSADEIKPMILGTSPIDGVGDRNEYGFYSKLLPVVQLTEGTPGGSLDIVPASVLTWTHNGETFKMDWSVTRMDKPISEVIPATPSANFQSMLKDGKLTGMVIAGSNMGEDAVPTLDEYQAYYEDQGFKFGKAQSLPKTLDFLKEQIESGTLDYFLKEAHSDGDEKNLFRMSKASKMKTGKKKRKDGTEEVFYLVYPDSTSTDDAASVLISNQDFGLWIKNREKNNGVEFVYYNASCWSESKVVNELEAAFSPILRILASITTVTTFTNDETQAEYQMLHQFRANEASWEKIREAMERDPEYANGSGDKMIFPDEPAYDERIRNVMKVPVAINSLIKKANGEPYNIDQQ
ncbi:MAG: hypothetical protein JNL01_04965 [Bdellovibrionales bacterium]|nr:hypothetical protein [Bdellovibrionales bacterium]